MSEEQSGKQTAGTKGTPPGNKWNGTYRVRYGFLEPSELPPLEWFGTQKAALLKGTLNHTNERKYKFFSRLIESVQQEGFRNPISWADPASKSGNQNKPYNYGGSRCMVAKHLEIPLPVIVCDHNHNPRYDSWKPIECIDDALSCFKDLPSYMEFTKNLFQFWGCDQTHLGEDTAGRRFFRLMQPKQDRAFMGEYKLGARTDARGAWWARFAGEKFEDGELTKFEPLDYKVDYGKFIRDTQ